MTRLIFRSRATPETRIILRLSDLLKAKQQGAAPGQLGLFGGSTGSSSHVDIVPHGHHLKLVEVKAHDRHTDHGVVHVDQHKSDVETHDWTFDHEFDANATRRLRDKSRLADVFQTPLGPLDEHGFAHDYHAALNQKHAAFDADDVAWAAK